MKSLSLVLVTLTLSSSVALAGSNKSPSFACYEGGLSGKVNATVKTQEECQKLGESFQWLESVAQESSKKTGAKAKTHQEHKPKAAQAETMPAVEASPAKEAAPAAKESKPVKEAPVAKEPSKS